MVKRSVEKLDRRYLLRAGLRIATFVLLGGVGAAAIAKRQRLVREGKCVSSGICGGCRVYEDCGLPQALSRKKVLAEADEKR